MITDPFGEAASASANSAESRSGANTLVSLASRRLWRSSVVSGSIGGIPNALLIRQSTRPNSASAVSTSRVRASSSVMSVGTTSARRPCDRTTSAIFSSRRSVRETSTRSAPILAASSPSERPRPGPTPDRTTTLSASRGTVTTASFGPRSAAARRSARRTPRGSTGEKCGSRSGTSARATFSTVGPSSGPRSRSSRCQRSMIGPVVPGGLQPVGDAGFALGDHVAQHPVGIDDRLRLGERGLVGLVVGRGVPVRPDLDRLVGTVGALRHRHHQRLVVGQLVVPDRRPLRLQAAGRGPRRGQRVHRLLVLEEVREREPGLDRADQQLARDLVLLRQSVPTGRRGRDAEGVGALDPEPAGLLGRPVVEDLADDQVLARRAAARTATRTSRPARP